MLALIIQHADWFLIALVVLVLCWFLLRALQNRRERRPNYSPDQEVLWGCLGMIGVVALILFAAWASVSLSWRVW